MPVVIVPIPKVVDNVSSISSVDEHYNLNSVAWMKDSDYNLNHSLSSRNDLMRPTIVSIVEDCLLFCKMNLATIRLSNFEEIISALQKDHDHFG